MKLEKYMLDGKYQKVNGNFIMSNGWFAFDGCHKVYLLESTDDLKEAMECSYRIYPILELKKTFLEDIKCPLRFIHNWKCNKRYVDQFDNADWSAVKVSRKKVS